MSYHIHWQANRSDLAKRGNGYYDSAVVTDYWRGGYIFKAYPRQGDWMTECHGDDVAELIEKAKRWMTGASPEGFYSASMC